jgi:ribosomal protein S18 acetylase RimI-like enzyme
MTVSVRRSGPSDRQAVLDLLERARGTGVSAQERTEQGFIQGRWDVIKVAELELGTGIFLAEEDGALAGIVVTSSGSGVVDEGPPRLTMDAVLASGIDTDAAGILFYGPITVAPEFRGRGVSRALLSAVARDLSERYRYAALFVEHSNHRSMTLHRHFGMREQAEFTFQDRTYTAFTFSLAAFAQ